MIDSSPSISLKTVVSESIGILTPIFQKTARDEAYQVIADCLSVPPSKIRLDMDRMTVNSGQRKEIIEKINRRTKREPIQYIAESAWFMGEQFKIGKGVLIPRNDTEILVEEALRIAKETLFPSVSSISSIPSGSTSSGDFRFFEFCTGSGCIALSFLIKMNEAGLDARGVATDISSEALSYAAENAKRLDCADQIRFFQWNMLSGQFPAGYDKYRMILANPPYIKSDVIATLEPEVLLYEPAIALDGGMDGLRFYRCILDYTENLLAPDGWVLFEIGYDQEQEILEMVKETGFFERISIIYDYGGNPRVVSAKKKG